MNGNGYGKAILEAGICALVVLAPLPFGAVEPVGRLALEAGALALTALWMLVALRGPVALPPPAVSVGIAGLIVVAGLQIVPLAGGLPPTLSLAPDATASALRTGAALAGLLLVTTSVVAATGAKRIALAALLSAAFQGLHGLLVLASGHDRIWNMPKTAYLDSATGTFINRNHFAAFLAATLPLGFGLIVAAARRARAAPRLRERLLVLFGADGSRSLLLGLLALLGLAGLMLSFSRAGTACALLAVAATLTVTLGGRLPRRAAIVALVVALAAIPLFDVGVGRLLGRYEAATGDIAAAGGRLDVWRDTLHLIAAAPVFGCGFGAFTWAFPAVSSPEVRLHYTHAHNDALQFLAEGGVVGAALALLLIVPLARAGGRVVTEARDPIAVGAVFGLLALTLHSLVDFNFHIPANAALAAVLAGVVFGASWTAER